VAAWPEFENEIQFEAKIPENPLAREIEFLRADTLKATRALAASFLPAPHEPN
jgi:hypothetical protein